MGRSKAEYEKLIDELDVYASYRQDDETFFQRCVDHSHELYDQMMSQIPPAQSGSGLVYGGDLVGVAMLDPIDRTGSVDGGDHFVVGHHVVDASYVNTAVAGHYETRFNGKTLHELFDEYFHGSHKGNDGVFSKTYDQKLDDINYTMREIESLFNALSLVINNPAERLAFDTMFNNWKNDKFADRYKKE